MVLRFKIKKTIALCTISVISFFCASTVVPTPDATTSKNVRLDTLDWHLQSPDGFVITSTKNKKRKNIHTPTLHLIIRNRTIIINQKKITEDSICISPLSGTMTNSGTIYVGTMTIVAHSTAGYLVSYQEASLNDQSEDTKPIAGVQHQSSGTTQSALPDIQPTIEPYAPYVRVLLLDTTITASMHVALKTTPDHESTPSRWMLKRTGKRPVYGTGPITITGDQKNRWSINGKCIGDTEIVLITNKGMIGYEDNWYHGALHIKQIDNKLLFINTVDLEEYVHSVLRTESWPGWPLEVNKAFAIASRSYVIAMMLRAQKAKKPYHVKNTNQHQTYTGIHKHDIIDEAIKQTRGIFLAYNNEPIVAMFDSCCGGVIPANIDTFDFSKAPYLARTYPCTHCKRSTIYNWSCEYGISQFIDSIKKERIPLQSIKDIAVVQWDKAGLVTKVVIKNSKQAIYLTGQKMYSLIKGIKSYCFGLRKKGERLIITGKGYGHHLGLCQWGAREMVRDGWKYHQILSFYYPGTEYVQAIKPGQPE